MKNIPYFLPVVYEQEIWCLENVYDHIGDFDDKYNFIEKYGVNSLRPSDAYIRR